MPPSQLCVQAVGLLADPDLPVRVDAVVALRLLIDTAEDVAPLKPVLPTLLNHIFNLMNQVTAGASKPEEPEGSEGSSRLMSGPAAQEQTSRTGRARGSLRLARTSPGRSCHQRAVKSRPCSPASPAD